MWKPLSNVLFTSPASKAWRASSVAAAYAFPKKTTAATMMNCALLRPPHPMFRPDSADLKKGKKLPHTILRISSLLNIWTLIRLALIWVVYPLQSAQAKLVRLWIIRSRSKPKLFRADGTPCRECGDTHFLNFYLPISKAAAAAAWLSVVELEGIDATSSAPPPVDKVSEPFNPLLKCD